MLPGPLRERGAEHSAADALLVVEVASPGNADRDRKTKLWGYAHGPVPLYLLIDRWDPVQGEPAATLYSKPVNGRYTNVQRVPFGEAVKLPEPFGFDLDTAEFPSRRSESRTAGAVRRPLIVTPGTPGRPGATFGPRR
ncbi:Uma2 family endonuclease [Nocardiopsis composta]